MANSQDVSVVEVIQVDRELRSELLTYIVASLERGCSDGDMPVDRREELDMIIARHRIATTETTRVLATISDYRECDILPQPRIIP